MPPRFTTPAPSSIASAPPPADLQVYTWKGLNGDGRPSHGEVRASTEALARLQLERQGFRTLHLRRRRVPRSAAVSAADRAVFTRQLASLIRAGIPLLQALDVLAADPSHPARAALVTAMRLDVATGHTLAQAMERQSGFFPALHTALVAAGEQAGALDITLERLAQEEMKALALRRRLRAALTYPVAVLVVAVGVVVALLVGVVPTFQEVFASFGRPLPAPTRWVVAVSNGLVLWGPWLAGVLALACWGLRRLWGPSTALREAVDRGLLRVPGVGRMIGQAVAVRWARTLSLMLACGLTVVQALEAVAQVAGHAVHRQATLRVQADVATGQGLAAAMTATGAFPALMLQMVRIGEESGTLDALLMRTAEFMEGELDESLSGLSGLIEPVVVVVLGLVIGGIVMAMYLPIFELGSLA